MPRQHDRESPEAECRRLIFPVKGDLSEQESVRAVCWAFGFECPDLGPPAPLHRWQRLDLAQSTPKRPARLNASPAFSTSCTPRPQWLCP